MDILITKKLNALLLDQIRSWGWHFDVVETLDISGINVEALPTKADVWVVSSRNSWAAVKKFISDAPSSIYCVGQWVKDELVKSGLNSEVRGFENIETLATHLKDQKFKSVLYFCADNHRGELDAVLTGSGISITKVITHVSRQTNPILNKSYDAVFVFSPRSAESILKSNSFQSQTIFACIGKTTETYLHKLGIKNTFCASFPDSKILLDEFRTRTGSSIHKH